ncbi:ATP-binding protein [Streptomyces sp. LBUM 1478]|nr:ATP-binding protein [Streptomyces sp. LBUM 1478]
MVPTFDETAKLVGRAADLARFDSVIGRVGQDDAPAVIDVAGDAGMGKSRLLSEFCARTRPPSPPRSARRYASRPDPHGRWCCGRTGSPGSIKLRS